MGLKKLLVVLRPVDVVSARTGLRPAAGDPPGVEPSDGEDCYVVSSEAESSDSECSEAEKHICFVGDCRRLFLTLGGLQAHVRTNHREACGGQRRSFVVGVPRGDRGSRRSEVVPLKECRVVLHDVMKTGDSPSPVGPEGSSNNGDSPAEEEAVQTPKSSRTEASGDVEAGGFKSGKPEASPAVPEAVVADLARALGCRELSVALERPSASPPVSKRTGLGDSNASVEGKQRRAEESSFQLHCRVVFRKKVKRPKKVSWSPKDVGLAPKAKGQAPSGDAEGRAPADGSSAGVEGPPGSPSKSPPGAELDSGAPEGSPSPIGRRDASDCGPASSPEGSTPGPDPELSSPSESPAASVGAKELGQTIPVDGSRQQVECH